jgi:hypothetical protein
VSPDRRIAVSLVVAAGAALLGGVAFFFGQPVVYAGWSLAVAGLGICLSGVLLVIYSGRLARAVGVLAIVYPLALFASTRWLRTPGGGPGVLEFLLGLLLPIVVIAVLSVAGVTAVLRWRAGSSRAPDAASNNRIERTV